MSATASSPRDLQRRRALQLLIERGPILVFVALFAYLALQSEFFLQWPNISSVLRQAAPDAILASGLAVVVVAGGDDVVAGGIDISLPAAATLGVALMADQLVDGTGLVVALLVGAAAIMAVAVVNMLLVTKVQMSALLATLATYVAAVGLYRWAIDNRRITVSDQPLINELRDGAFLAIPLPAWLALGVLAVVGWTVHRTRFGLRMQATGGNREAAEISGLHPNRYVAASYLIAGGCAVVASLVLIARGSGLSPGIEERLLLDMVLATFVGAAFSRRRVVTVAGAVLGAVLVKALGSGFQLIQVDIFRVDMIKGILILIVVASSSFAGKGRR